MIARGADGQRASSYMIDTFWDGTDGRLESQRSEPEREGDVLGRLRQHGDPDRAGGLPDCCRHHRFRRNAQDRSGDDQWRREPGALAAGDANRRRTARASSPTIRQPANRSCCAYDAATKTVGGVTGVFDNNTKKFVPIAEAAAATTPADARLSALQGFVASSYLARHGQQRSPGSLVRCAARRVRTVPRGKRRPDHAGDSEQRQVISRRAVRIRKCRA